MEYARPFIRQGDTTTSEGVVEEGSSTFTADGRGVTYEGDAVWCPACQTMGVTVCVPPFRPFTSDDGRQVNLHGDLCACACSTPPRLVASCTTVRMTFAGHEMHRDIILNEMGMPAVREKRVTESSSSWSHADLDPICPNMTNAEFATMIMERRDKAIALVSQRRNELERWSKADRERVAEWFGSSDHHVRSRLHSGLAKLHRTLQGLTPANFVRYSEKAMALVGCTSNAQRKIGVVAEVCAPDTATRTIAIHLDFCHLRDYSFTRDSQVSTLIHEVTHFVDTFGARDHQYFMDQSRKLAWTHPDLAIENADSITGYIVYDDR